MSVQLDHYSRLAESSERGARAALYAILASALLAAVKILAGMIGHSYALIADGVESMLDIFGSIVVWGSLRIAGAPPTERYPYGFGKVEPLASVVIATALLVAATGIAIQSVREIVTPHHLPAWWTLLVLVLVVITKEVMYRRLARTGRTIGSQSVQTDAWHHRSDAITSLAAFIGILAAVIGGPGWEEADDWAALVACGVIAFNGGRLFRNALREVLDVAAPAEIIGRVREIAMSVTGVRDMDKVRVRRSGLGFFADIHVIVDADVTVAEGHRIAHDVVDALRASDLDIVDVVAHVEPDRYDLGIDSTGQPDTE